MARRPAGMEPAPEIASYDDVPWYRKQWFLWVLILFFWPPLIYLAATGDLFAKANRKMKEHSPAEVWRYSGGGKAMIFAAGLIFSILIGIQIFAALSADDGRPNRRPAATQQDDEPEPASVDDSGTATTQAAESVSTTEAPTTTLAPTTTSTTTTTTIVPGEIDDVISEIVAVAGETFEPGDVRTPIIGLADAFPILEGPADAMLENITVRSQVGSGFSEGEVQYNAFSNYVTQSGVEEVVVFYVEEAARLDLPERELINDSDDEGPFTEIEFGDFGSHPDPDIEWSVLSVVIRSGDAGTEVRTSHTVNRLGTAVDPSSLLARLAAATPIDARYVVDSVDVSIGQVGGPPFINTSVQVVIPEVIADDAAEIEQLAAVYEASGGFVVDAVDGDRVTYRLPASPDVRATTSIGFKSDDETNVYHRLSFDG